MTVPFLSYRSGIQQEMDTRWKESQPLWQQWWMAADLDMKMATGQQDYWNTFYNINYRNQKILLFNKILRMLNMVSGYQMRNRLATVCNAVDDGGEDAQEEFTKILYWVMNQDRTYHKISECFQGSNMVGLNLQCVYMDFREDPENGEICTSRIPYNAFLMDNYWTKRDLSDCDWIWTRKYLTRKQVLSLYPKLKKDLPNLNKGYGAKDGRFQFMGPNWYMYQQELYAYDEYWTRDYRRVKKIVDMATGEVVEWKGTEEQYEMLQRVNPNVKMITATKPTVKLHVIVNGEEVYTEKQPYGIDRYPFIPHLCYHFPEVQNYEYRYQGIVRNVRDSQIELNRRRNRMLDMFDAQVQSGIIAKEDTFIQPEEAYKQGPGQVLWTKQGANIQSDIQMIQPPQIPQSLFELQKMLDEEIMSIAGVNEELFGEMKKGDPSGFLTQLRMGAGLTSLQNVFDNLNESQMLLGDIMLDLIQANFGPGKVRKILGHDSTMDWDNRDFRKFRCVTEEAELTTTQRELQFMQALQLKQMGVNIPSKYLLQKSTLQGKKDLIASIEAEEKQAAEMQQKAAQIQMHQEAMLARSFEAKAQNDFGRAIEAKTRAVSNIGLAKERASQAEHDRAKAALDNAKAAKEISQIEEDRLMKLTNYIVQISQAQKMLAGGEEDDAREVSENVGANILESEKATREKTESEPEPLNMAENTNAQP